MATKLSFHNRRTIAWVLFVHLALLFAVQPVAGEEVTPEFQTTREEPWLLLRVTQDALDRFARTRIYDAPVAQDILGAWVTGTSTNDVTITPRLMQSSDSLRVSLDLAAVAVSTTSSRKRAATIQSLSTTYMEGHKLLDFDGHEFKIHPATVQGATTSQITGFGWSRMIGKGMAWRQTLQTKAAAERESARKASLLAEHKLDQEVDELADRLLASLKDRQEFARVLGSCNCVVTMQTGDEIAECRVSPNLNTKAKLKAAEQDESRIATDHTDHAIELHLDERLLEEVAKTAVGGRSFSEDTWHKLGKLIPKMANGLEIHDANQHWDITFAETPLDINFTDDQVQLTIYLTKLTRGTQELPAMNVSVSYELAAPDANSIPTVLRRVGRPDARPTEKPASFRIGFRQQVLRSMVRERISPLMPEEIPLRSSSIADELPGLSFPNTLLRLQNGRMEFLAD